MTQDEWVACNDATPMLELLRSDRTTSERKLRLFAVACLRRIWDLLDDNNRRATESLEEFLDGRISQDSLGKATAYDPSDNDWGLCLRDYASDAVAVALRFDLSGHDAAFWVAELIRVVTENVARNSRFASIPIDQGYDADAWKICDQAVKRAITAEKAAQSHLVREIFHGPCRSVQISGQWRTPAIMKRVSDIYLNRGFEEMPLLANELENAGCTETSILRHCRQHGPHVRGCWVIDALLCVP